jgi:predicted TIM-barrel fold metal-dependent hydrolase
MTQEKLTIISSDCHAGPADMRDYRPFIDPDVRDDFDDYVARIDAYEAGYDDGKMTAGGAGAVAGEDGLWDMAVRERFLDADGIAAELIFAQGGYPFGTHPAVPTRNRNMDWEPTPRLDVAGCRAYNRWLAAFCASDTNRHLGIARVPLPDVAASIAEVEWAAKNGLRGGVALPALSRVDLPPFNHPMYEPFWAACEANGMVLNMHGGGQLTYGDGPDHLAIVLAETDFFSHRGLAHLIFGGVFERHPDLHLAITEQRNHWLHPLMKELDSIYHWKNCAPLRQVLPRLPSDYFRTNCFIGASFMSRLECEARGELGAQCFMWGSDYPHMEGAWPYTETSLRWTFGCGVSSDELRAMIGGNAARCYGVDLAALAPIAARIGPTEAQLRVPVEPPIAEIEAAGRWTWAFRQEGPWH